MESGEKKCAISPYFICNKLSLTHPLSVWPQCFYYPHYFALKRNPS